MELVFLDTKTMGDVPNLHIFDQFGKVDYYPLTLPHELLQRCEGKEVVITNKVVFTADTLKQLPHLRLICLTATGMNNIDCEFARSKGIKVVNVSGYSTESVAQSTFAMLLYVLHQLKYYDNYVVSGQYCNSDIFTHYGPAFWQLSGKRFGIIGMGNIGRCVARIAASFGCEVVYCSTSGQNTGQPYKQLSLQQLLQTSDVVSIHAPLNEQTHNLISYEQLKCMLPHAILLNVGRGGIVNEADLARAIDEELIAAAALDVLEREPMLADNPLQKIKRRERLLIVPHIAWASVEARTLLLEKVAENIKNYVTLC